MKVSDIMTRNVRVVSPDRTIQEAARLMDDMNVGVLPVCDGRRLRGMITDRDITVRATAAGLPPDTTRVRDVMSDNVWWCFDDDDVNHIVQLMSDHQIRRLPVVDHDKHLVGIVALGDLATDQEDQASRALHRISTPSEPDRTGTLTSARADQTRGGGQARLTGDERRELERRLQNDGDDRRHRPHDYHDQGERDRRSGAGREQFRFREEDDVRAAFGSFGYPGEEGARDARMRGGFGGEGYQSYGDEYAGPGSAGRGFRPRRYGASTITGERARPGDDSSETDRRMQDRERTWSLVNERHDRSNYGMGPGNTRFGNDATASSGEVRRDDHRGRGPRNYQRSDDRIREDVSERLSDDPMIDASEIEVAVQNREVTLTGTVRDRNEKPCGGHRRVRVWREPCAEQSASRPDAGRPPHGDRDQGLRCGDGQSGYRDGRSHRRHIPRWANHGRNGPAAADDVSVRRPCARRHDGRRASRAPRARTRLSPRDEGQA